MRWLRQRGGEARRQRLREGQHWNSKHRQCAFARDMPRCTMDLANCCKLWCSYLYCILPRLSFVVAIKLPDKWSHALINKCFLSKTSLTCKAKVSSRQYAVTLLRQSDLLKECLGKKEQAHSLAFTQNSGQALLNWNKKETEEIVNWSYNWQTSFKYSLF